MTETCIALPGAKGPIIIEGPVARNRLYAEALSALTERAVMARGGLTGTSGGAALLARGTTSMKNTTPAPNEAVSAFADTERLRRYAKTWNSLTAINPG